MPLPPNATRLDILAHVAVIKAYLAKVKERFVAGSPKHLEFYQNVGNFWGDRENLHESIAIMTSFLQNHQDLIDGFEEFLPLGYVMNPDPLHVFWKQYEWRVKTTYTREPGVYEEFIRLCSRSYLRGLFSSHFMLRIEKLFKDHQELVERLKIFLRLLSLSLALRPRIVVTGPDGIETDPEIG